MHSYIDLYFTPESLPPPEISKRLRAATGLSFIRGRHDIAFDWTTEEEFRSTLAKIHGALKGTGVLYRVETVADEATYVAPVPWPALPQGDKMHPGY